MASTSGEPEAEEAAATTIYDVDPKIIQTHILTRLDGVALASFASTCSKLSALSSDEQLWTNACHSTWPSTMDPRVYLVISMLRKRHRSFFADSFPTSCISATATTPINPNRTPKLISAVDLFHRNRLIFSKVVETETFGKSQSSRFLVGLANPYDVIRSQTQVNSPICEDTLHDLGEELRLSWIVIDSAARRAVNVSSNKPVSVQLQDVRGFVQLRFATVVDGGERGTATEQALFNVEVKLGGEDCMDVKEASLHMEDLDGKRLNWRDGLVILKRAMEGERIRKKNVGEDYGEFVKRKNERRRMRREG